MQTLTNQYYTRRGNEGRVGGGVSDTRRDHGNALTIRSISTVGVWIRITWLSSKRGTVICFDLTNLISWTSSIVHGTVRHTICIPSHITNHTLERSITTRYLRTRICSMLGNQDSKYVTAYEQKYRQSNQKHYGSKYIDGLCRYFKFKIFFIPLYRYLSW